MEYRLILIYFFPIKEIYDLKNLGLVLNQNLNNQNHLKNPPLHI